jgi:hypothetical protein
MGLDFEMPFEVHIVKAYFEEIFGIGTAPQKRDIVYFPLANRIYEVESSYLWKDIMQREVYWKVSLKKYAPKSNRYEPQDLREQLDSISWDAEERFGEEVREDEIKVTKPQQYDPKIGSRNYDPTRLNINDDLVITQDDFRNYNLTLSESQYDLRSIFSTTANPTAVTYRAKSVFSEAAEEERSLLGWFKEIKPRVTLPKDVIRGQIQKGAVGLSKTPVSFVITMKRSYQLGDLLKVTRFNGLSFYGTYLSTTPIAGGFLVSMEVDNEILSFLDSYYAGWASTSVTSGYHLEPAYETILLDGYDVSTQSGWKLSIYASRYFVFKSTSEKITFILPNNLIEGSWYAFFLNINNFYQQVSLDVWIRKWSETDSTPQRTTDLENIYSKTYISQPVNRTAGDGDYNYKLPASNLVYTNIRLFNKTETDLIKQMTILNQTIVQDAQYAIIVDNAISRLNLPFFGKTK